MKLLSCSFDGNASLGVRSFAESLELRGDLFERLPALDHPPMLGS
jgi:hypothetical protein